MGCLLCVCCGVCWGVCVLGVPVCCTCALYVNVMWVHVMCLCCLCWCVRVIHLCCWCARVLGVAGEKNTAPGILEGMFVTEFEVKSFSWSSCFMKTQSTGQIQQ